MRANRWRVRTGEFASDETAGFNGHFLVPLEGELWFVRISDHYGWRHLSVSNAQKSQIPPWNVMCRLKDSFFGDDSWAVQYHPAKSDHVNDHAGVLHLWEPLEDKLPQPPVFLI